jgi:ferredoxin
MTAKIDADACTGCETCVDACPEEAIEMKDDIAVVDADSCSDCGTCVDVCPTEAITMDE